jgi:hypothetical protein
VAVGVEDNVYASVAQELLDVLRVLARHELIVAQVWRRSWSLMRGGLPR